MNKSDHNPYHYGGAVDRKKYIYVETDAHQQLYKSLKAGQLCCVFNARKAGKTSLKNGIRLELLKDGYKCISLDFSMMASEDTNQTMDRWYYSFFTKVARELEIQQIKDSPLNKWWNEERKYLDSIDKVTIFFEDEVLSSCQHKIIIFIDEVDSVKRLPFSTDGFFTWIRGIYQKKSESHNKYQYERLNFCLLGVAKVSELIKNPEVISFNLAKDIPLTGFSIEEALEFLITKQLKDKVENHEDVLKIVLEKTGGQPYLTLKLLNKIVSPETPRITRDSQEEQISKLIEIYITDKKGEGYGEHDYFGHIEKRIMKYDTSTIDTPSDEIKTSRLLNLYREILEGKEVKWNSSNDDHLDLQLSGLVSNQKEYLLPISPIHKKVFDLAWTDECLSKIIPMWYREKLRGWTLSNSDVSKRDRYYLLYGKQLQEAKAKEKYKFGEENNNFIVESRALYRANQESLNKRLIDLSESKKEIIINRVRYWTSYDIDIFDKLIEVIKTKIRFMPHAMEITNVEGFVNRLVEEHLIRNWKTEEIFLAIHKTMCKLKENNEDSYFSLLIMYGQILCRNSENRIRFSEQDSSQRDLLDIGLIKKRYSLSQNNYYLEVANPIYSHIFNLDENDFKLYENEFNKSYIGMMLPDRRGYGKKLGMWLITQNQKYLLLAEELEIIISHLGNQQLSDEEHKFLVKSQIRTSNSDSEFLEQQLVQLVIDMQKNPKASNPQMMIKKIFEQIKPKYVKCIAIICNLLDQHNNFINEGEEEKIINEVVEKFSDCWQENEEGQHLQEIRDQIINHERSLYLLLLYQQILTENDQVNPTYINSNDLEYLMGLDLVVSEEELKVSNKLYKEVFDSSFVTQEIENKINSLVKSQWQFNNELKEETKQEVTDLITKTSILLPLSTKTNNLERLISLILEWSKPDHTLLKLLVNSITESQGRILLNDNNQEARKSFNNFVRMHLTDNWQENSSVDATINPRNIVKSTIMPTEKMIDQPINPEISIDVLLERIMSKAESYLKAIIVVNLQNGEVVENNYNEDELDKSVYKQVIGKGSGGVAIEDFDTFIPHIKALQKFSEERDVGELDYSIYAFTQGLVIGAFLDIEGTFYGIFYIAKSGVSRGKLINMCEQTIPQIKKAFQQDQDFTVM